MAFNFASCGTGERSIPWYVASESSAVHDASEFASEFVGKRKTLGLKMESVQAETREPFQLRNSIILKWASWFPCRGADCGRR